MMSVESARKLVGQILYKPGWTFSTESHERRYQDAFKLRIDYPARNSDREQAPDYLEEIQSYAEFVIVVGEGCDETALYKKIMEKVLAIEEHEAREFFRVEPTYWAPFHPHHPSGTELWGATREADLQFGVA